jgi:hypothetical protein
VALQAGTPVDISVAYESHVAEYTRGADPIRKVIENALLSVMEGKQTSKNTLEAAAREANQLLAQA